MRFRVKEAISPDIGVYFSLYENKSVLSVGMLKIFYFYFVVPGIYMSTYIFVLYCSY